VGVEREIKIRAIFIGKLLNNVPDAIHLLFGCYIQFIAQNDDSAVLDGIGDLVNPSIHICARMFVVQVVDDDSDVRASIVRAPDGAESKRYELLWEGGICFGGLPFLPSGIP
jgi:hypothetical protein